MRIIHLVENKAWGGGEQYVYNICQHLKADGIDVEIFCRPVGGVLRGFQTLDIPLHTLPLKGIADLYSAMVIARHLQSGDVIHVHNFKTAFTACLARSFARIKDVRIVLTRHLVRRGKTSFLYSWLYGQLDKIIFVSKVARDEFMSTKPVVSPEKIVVLHNSIVEKGNPSTGSGQALSTGSGQTDNDIRRQLSLPDDSRIIMFHGRLAEEKGISNLIRAFSCIKDKKAVLVLIGNGEKEYIQRLKEEISACGMEKRVHLLGFKENVFPYISQADIGVQPSIVREAFSLACLEYMSQGRCVIATDNGGQVEFITDGESGVLVLPPYIESLTKAMDFMLEGDRYKEFGKKAKEIYKQKFSYATFYNKLLGIYGQ